MYLPAHGETVYLVPGNEGYNYLHRCPLKVLNTSGDTCTVEFMPHPAFVNGVRHKKNDMVGFRASVTTDNLVPEALREPYIWYMAERVNMVNAIAGGDNLTISQAKIDEIWAQYRKDYGPVIGKTYSITGSFQRKNASGEWEPVTQIKTVTVIDRPEHLTGKSTIRVKNHADGKEYPVNYPLSYEWTEITN